MLVKRHHPDANGGDRGSEDRLREIIQAYNYLKICGFLLIFHNRPQVPFAALRVSARCTRYIRPPVPADPRRASDGSEVTEEQ